MRPKNPTERQLESLHPREKFSESFSKDSAEASESWPRNLIDAYNESLSDDDAKARESWPRNFIYNVDLDGPSKNSAEASESWPSNVIAAYDESLFEDGARNFIVEK